VVAASDLPVGPACAAILVHMEPGHGLQISVGVRSLACGSVVVFGFDAPIAASVVNVALDSALSFAESMGFLFDDDMVDDDSGSQEKAVLRWQEMIGEVLTAPGDDRSESEPIELFDADGSELTDPPEPVEQPPAAPAPEQAVTLSKFRIEPDAGSEPMPTPNEVTAPKSRRHAVGRMRLVRRGGKQRAPDARRVWLLKLLTSF